MITQGEDTGSVRSTVHSRNGLSNLLHQRASALIPRYEPAANSIRTSKPSSSVGLLVSIRRSPQTALKEGMTPRPSLPNVVIPNT
ncbi:MAG: hypothetical protein [Cressdnaviricota sp.]|nr:MAG: hypothetical protein [Cressdnaviricota sp.]